MSLHSKAKSNTTRNLYSKFVHEACTLADIWEESACSYPGRSDGGRGDELQHDNPCCETGLNHQKSAEVIVGLNAEGPNIRRFLNLKDSANTGERQSQITLWGKLHKGSPCKDRLEANSNKEACKPPTASTREKNNEKTNNQNLLEAILEPENLNAAYEQVKRNRGSHGVDGMTVNDLLKYLKEHGQELREALRSGNYIPSPVRRVEIPKPDGGERQLGIPTVIDRMIQQAMAQILSPIFEPTFTNSSYGFRPGKNCHQAIRKAQRYMNAGNTWVVDIDLAKYFDTVNVEFPSKMEYSQGDFSNLHTISSWHWLPDKSKTNGCSNSSART